MRVNTLYSNWVLFSSAITKIFSNGGPNRQMQEAIVRFLWSVSLVRVAGNFSVIWPDASIFMHMGLFTE